METEKFRGYVAALVAAIGVVGGALGAVYVWQFATGVNPPPDTTLIFGVFTGLIGSGTTFLFMADSASRASHAAERSFTSGSITGAQLPEQLTVDPGTTLTGSATTATQTGDAPLAQDD